MEIRFGKPQERRAGKEWTFIDKKERRLPLLQLYHTEVSPWLSRAARSRDLQYRRRPSETSSEHDGLLAPPVGHGPAVGSIPFRQMVVIGHQQTRRLHTLPVGSLSAVSRNLVRGLSRDMNFGALFWLKSKIESIWTKLAENAAQTTRCRPRKEDSSTFPSPTI